MILDSLKSFEKYQALQEGFDKVYQFIRKNNLHTLEEGKHEIDEGKIWCTIQSGELKGYDEAKLEVHDSYIDIHVLLEGTETIGIRDRACCKTENSKYDEVNDIAFTDDEPENYVILGPDNIAIVFPADAHAPLLGSGQYKKAVFKVKINRGGNFGKI